MKIKLVLVCILSLLGAWSAYAQDTTLVEEKVFRESELDRLTSRFTQQTQSALGDYGIDVKYYKIDIQVTTSPSYVKGSVTMIAATKTEGLASLTLDLQSPMTVDSAFVGGIKVGVQNVSPTVTLALDRSYHLGELITVKMYYQGLPTPIGYGSFKFSTHNTTTPWVWSLSEPYGAKSWWPCKDHPSDKADSADIIVRVSNQFRVGSNGLLVSTVNNGDSTITYHWHESYPIASYLISVAITDYTIMAGTYTYAPGKTMQLLHYVLPEALGSASFYLSKTANMLGVLAAKFGQYPFINEKYGHAQFGWSGGMEHQTMTSLGVYQEYIMVHEMAHQWFGDMITCGSWHDIWLNEGFATYGEALYAEKTYGKPTYLSRISSYMTTAKTTSLSVYATDTVSLTNMFSTASTYDKGACVLHMLRGILGDTVFFNSLYNYANSPTLRYSSAVTADLQNVFQTTSGKDLTYFFNEWVKGTRYPTYTYSGTIKPLSTGSRVTLKLTQTTGTTNPSFFTMPVEFHFTVGGKDSTFNATNNSASQWFVFDVTASPTSISLDPSGWILKSLNGVLPFVNPDSLNLGNVRVGQFREDSITVYNFGTTATVAAPSFDLTNFTASPASLDVAAGGSARFAIRFTPSATGAKYGHATFAFSGGPSVQMVVTGNGVAPLFSIVPTSINFGIVNAGSSKKDSVTISNSGTALLTLTTAVSDTSVVTVSPPSATIAPNQSAKLFLTFTPVLDGTLNAHLIVTHDAAGSPTSVPIGGTGHVLTPHFVVVPESLDFGNVLLGSSSSDTIIISNTGDAPLVIASITTDSSIVSVSPSSGTIPPLASAKFAFTFTPTSCGLRNLHALINYNGSGSPAMFLLKGNGIVPTPHFVCDHDSLVFGLTVVASQSRDSLLVTNTGNGSLEISSVVSDSTAFSAYPVSASIPPAQSRWFVVTFTPNRNGVVTGRMTFNSNSPTSPNRIVMQGAGHVLAPVIVLTPDSIDFGSIFVGASRTDTITVANPGDGTLVISSISVDSAIFSVSPQNATILPAQNARFAVRFAPTSGGQRSSYLTIIHNGSDSRTRYHLGGTGVVPAPYLSLGSDSLMFPLVNVGSSVTDSVSIMNTGNALLQVSSILSDSTAFTVSPSDVSIAPLLSTKCAVTFTPGRNGTISGRISFIHNGINSPTYMQVRGTGHLQVGTFSSSKDSVTFGLVTVGSMATDSVIITNSGDATLIISNVASDSSSFSVSPSNRSIAPLQSQKFYVVFSPASGGAKAGRLFFTHNGTASPGIVYLRGSARVPVPLFSVVPTSLDFGQVTVGSSRSDSLVVTNAGDAALVVASAISDTSIVTINPISASIAAGQRQKFTVTFAPTSNGIRSAHVVFTHNAATSPSSVSISGSGKVLTGFFGLSRDSINLGLVNVGSSTFDSVTVSNTGEAQLIISSVASDGVNFIATPSSAAIAPGAHRSFFITYTPTSGGAESAHILFTHNGSNQTGVLLAKGTGNVLAAFFTPSRASVDFGQVIAHHTKTDSVTVTNTGNASMTITSATSNRGVFSVLPSSTSIASGKSRKFIITFTPTGENHESGVITFVHNGANSPSSITVSGSGYTWTTILREQQYWNLVSSPLIDAATSKEFLFPGNSSQAYCFDPGIGYTGGSSISQGRGYWLKFASDALAPVSGNPCLAETISVTRGWNLIGSIAYPVPVSTIASIPGGIMTSVFFGYDGGYRTCDTLLPGKGYWVSMNQSGSLLLNSQVLPATSSRIQILPDDIMPPSPPDRIAVGMEIPREYSLAQNFPNPFNPSTRIQYGLPVASQVHLAVYNVMGQLVADLFNGMQDPGFREVLWNASACPSGLYFYRLDVVSLQDHKTAFSKARKLLLLK